MTPIVTPDEMSCIDADAEEPVGELIARAGWAVAIAARAMLGATYGRRVAVIAGKGNNGADGRTAAAVLSRWGVRCDVFEADQLSTGPLADARVGRFDLVIDAAYGTGFHGRYQPPDVGSTPVLAVDIPSGVDGSTGAVPAGALAATRTITFAALKPGLVQGAGRRLAGVIEVADIGLDCSRARAELVGPDDLSRWPARGVDHHKWQTAVLVIGGGPTMSGAPALAVDGAARAGASHVLSAVPGTASGVGMVESVGVDLGDSWAGALEPLADRLAALVIGPGLPTDDATKDRVRQVLAAVGCPVVVDAGGLDAVSGWQTGVAGRDGATVLTPHDGEWGRLMGRPVGPDRFEAARSAASDYGATVLLKGSSTIVSDRDGTVRVVSCGDQRLATAGSGDVLAGVIGAGLAGGLTPLDAAGLGAALHAAGARRGRKVGLVAGDLPSLIADELDAFDVG